MADLSNTQFFKVEVESTVGVNDIIHQVYDALTENRELAVRMLDIVSKML